METLNDSSLKTEEITSVNTEHDLLNNIVFGVRISVEFCEYSIEIEKTAFNFLSKCT